MKPEHMMASRALAQDKPKAKKGKKKMPTMRIQPADSGGFVVHHEPDADDMQGMPQGQTHAMADVEALHNHIHKSYGKG